MSDHRFCGVTRGLVVSDQDPEKRNRLLLVIPEFGPQPLRQWVLGSLSLPLPVPGDEVWVAFEKGDPDNPVWLGKVGGTGNVSGS